MHRRIAGSLAGKVTKWIVVVFWVAVLAVSAGLSTKLTGAEKNDSISWLPGQAEATQVLQKQSAFTSPNTIPAVVVYEKTAGLSPADFAAAKADVARFGGMPELDGKVIGPSRPRTSR